MSRLATARRSSQAGWLGVSSSIAGRERRALSGAIGRPEDREGRRIAVVRMAVSVLPAEVVVRDVPWLPPLVQERAIAVLRSCRCSAMDVRGRSPRLTSLPWIMRQ